MQVEGWEIGRSYIDTDPASFSEHPAAIAKRYREAADLPWSVLAADILIHPADIGDIIPHIHRSTVFADFHDLYRKSNKVRSLV